MQRAKTLERAALDGRVKPGHGVWGGCESNSPLSSRPDTVAQRHPGEGRDLSRFAIQR